MERVKDILERRPAQFYRIDPECLLGDALYQMCTNQVECLAVMNRQEEFLGLLSWYDVARKILETNRSFRKIRVFAAISTQQPFADINDTIENCVLLMTGFQVHFLPVFEGMTFKSILSVDDILREAVHFRFRTDKLYMVGSADKAAPAI